MIKIQIIHSDEGTSNAVQEALGQHFTLMQAPVNESDPFPQDFSPSDLLILDFDLPDVAETLRLIRNQGVDTETILLLPPKYPFKTVSALFRFGIQECVVKPFEQEDLLRSVRKVKGLPEPEVQQKEE
ncbi:MAG: hypothetical protein VYA34_06820 [Myxococcota bacterium]|nr:hypothetical protein [Myxococcota bacterium]